MRHGESQYFWLPFESMLWSICISLVFVVFIYLRELLIPAQGKLILFINTHSINHSSWLVGSLKWAARASLTQPHSQAKVLHRPTGL